MIAKATMTGNARRAVQIRHLAKSFMRTSQDMAESTDTMKEITENFKTQKSKKIT
jgi:hypothetical protein